jgi:hypothetical protein
VRPGCKPPKSSQNAQLHGRLLLQTRAFER